MNKIILQKSIKLNALIRESKDIIEYVFGNLDDDISSIEYDSREVKDKSLFVAIPGFTSDGHNFIKAAVEKGAKAVVVASERVSEFSDLKEKGITLLKSDDARRSLASLSASFYQHPCSRVPVIGITGTNGKTSITFMLEFILKCHGYSPGVIGTVNYRWKDKEIQSSNTTPESRDLQEIFANMISDGVDAIIMEVSSHGLKLFRADYIDFDSVIFTNFTRDHLDFHETFDDYFASKRRIFKLLEKSCKKDKCSVVNNDDEYGQVIINEEGSPQYAMLSYGVNNDADYKPELDSINNTIDGISYILEKPEKGVQIDLNVSGKFHVYNSLSAVAASHSMGIPMETIRNGLSGLTTIPGRFDRIKSKLGFSVIVDYAHTDDAILNLLHSARDLNPKRIITLFGCGGNRDKSKRPLMGRAATTNSDWVIVTSDNPRDEEPEDIIEDIVSDLDAINFEIMPDRREAIKKAIYMAEEDDMVVIAGKGHENYQLIGGKRIDFDDRELARQYIAEKELC